MLTSSWQVDDEGEVQDLLGVEIARNKDSVVLKQTAYIQKMVENHFPDGVPANDKDTKYPCDKSIEDLVAVAQADEATRDPESIRKYQSIVGALLYAATNTRPDIALAVSYLCRCMAKPTPELHQAALRVLRYLHRTRHLGLRYEMSEEDLKGYSDSDWAVKHSISGSVFIWGRAAINWSCKKQPSVALSSCEAEIMAASESSKDAVYFSRFLTELGLGSSTPPALGVDNQGAIDLAYNPEHHQRTKHIERRHFYVRELVEQHEITVPYVPTDENVADFFTKPLTDPKFTYFRDIIMNVPRAASLCVMSEASAHGGVLREVSRPAQNSRMR